MKKITILTTDRVGLLADLLKIMVAAGIEIENVDSEQHNQTAVICMSVDRHDDALKALANTEFKAIAEDTILVKLVNEPGVLAKLAVRFKDARINLHSLRLICKEDNHAIVAISAERSDEVRDLVKDVMI